MLDTVNRLRCAFLLYDWQCWDAKADVSATLGDRMSSGTLNEMETSSCDRIFGAQAVKSVATPSKAIMLFTAFPIPLITMGPYAKILTVWLLSLCAYRGA